MAPPNNQSPRMSRSKIFYGALMALVLIYFSVRAMATLPGEPETDDDRWAPPERPQAAPPRPQSTPEPTCYDIYKFCVGLKSLEDQIVGSDGLPVEETSEGPSWRMITATLRVGLKSGESRGTFTDSDVALLDTAGVRHANDNLRVGLEDQSAIFDRSNRMTSTVVVVFLLDEEEVECVEVTARYTNEPLCLRA